MKYTSTFSHDGGYPAMDSCTYNNAPFNTADDPSPIEKEITICQSLSKDVTVRTSDYIPGEYLGNDEDGYPIEEANDFSETDWKEVLSDNYKMTPLEIIGASKKALTELLEEVKVTSLKEKWYRQIIDNCDDWIDDDTYIG